MGEERSFARHLFDLAVVNQYIQKELAATRDGEQQVMATHTAPRVTALQAQAAANLFLSDQLPDRFTADQPLLNTTGNIWHVPVILAYPGVGSLGQVGEVLVDVSMETVISYTSLDIIKQAAQDLYNARRDDIEAVFS